MISQSLITEFQQALKEDYGKDVDFDEASKLLASLVDYYDQLARMDRKILLEKEVL